jgi:hypothetical protein
MAIIVEHPHVDVSTYSTPLMNIHSTLVSFIIRYLCSTCLIHSFFSLDATTLPANLKLVRRVSQQPKLTAPTESSLQSSEAHGRKRRALHQREKLQPPSQPLLLQKPQKSYLYHPHLLGLNPLISHSHLNLESSLGLPQVTLQDIPTIARSVGKNTSHLVIP